MMIVFYVVCGDSGDRVPAVGGAKVPSNRKTSRSWNSYVNEDSSSKD